MMVCSLRVLTFQKKKEQSDWDGLSQGVKLQTRYNLQFKRKTTPTPNPTTADTDAEQERTNASYF